MKTTAELEALKENWKSDPCWDIEETEGFELYKEELLAFRRQCDADWNEKYNQIMYQKSYSMGIPGNIQLAEYIINLENRIIELEIQIVKNS